jgi:adenylate cyclase
MGVMKESLVSRLACRARRARRGNLTRTFVFADLAGFTALTEARGDEHAAEVVRAFRRAVAALLPACHARDVKWIGDAVLLSFTDPREAVRVAVRIVGEAGLPPVRVGVHTGTAVRRDGDWFGSGVNVAARVADCAPGGQVVITDATRAAAGDLGAVEVCELEQVALKNLSRPVRLFAAAV